jgi:non-specific serine/threonine protein kinase/serine/threonine-protein kinase
VLDAGATQTGRPYFVMDLVEGDPISGYCDRGNLPIPARLELFTQVCHAVQHAHTKGIIHRDIKPSNVLVSTHDGRPHVKVIDFGIAKATSGPLKDGSTVTVHQMVIGTPEYMSPEQAQGSLDIDTRTDVYALGVLLYELVTGTTPFSETELRKVAYEEMRRIICDVDPIRPSARLSQSTETLTGIAARRQTAPRRLGAAVRGDLDWVVMRALEKDRQRRYQTASALATDVERVLRGEAVSAAPPSTAYRLRKFVRRNRAEVIAGAAIAAALVVGACGFAWQARVTKHQRDRAVAAEAEVRKRAGELQEVSQFQARMLAQVDPAKAGLLLTKDVESRYEQALAKSGVRDSARNAQRRAFAAQWSRVNATDAARDLIDRTILTPAVDAIDKEFAGQPLVDATLRQSLAKLYKNLGLLESALPLQEKALASRRRLLGPEHLETLDSLVETADLLRAQAKFVEAEPLSREAMETCRRALGGEHPLTLAATNNLGFLLKTMGRSAEAEPYLRSVVIALRVSGSSSPSARRDRSRASRSVCSASGILPAACSAVARLISVASVSRWSAPTQ